jgi:Holliday junction resolvasome RuvABC endonuclease subunit
MKILGLDISSSVIGWALLEINENTNRCCAISLIDYGFYQPKKTGNIIEELALTRTDIKTLIETHKPDQVAIEQLIEFMKGASSSKTIIKLTSYNRMISLLAYDYLGKVPNIYNVLAIRHGIKLNKKFPAKDEIPDLVAKHLKIKFQWKLNKKGNKRIENYDCADAIAVALYHCFILTGKKKKK